MGSSLLHPMQQEMLRRAAGSIGSRGHCNDCACSLCLQRHSRELCAPSRSASYNPTTAGPCLASREAMDNAAGIHATAYTPGLGVYQPPRVLKSLGDETNSGIVQSWSEAGRAPCSAAWSQASALQASIMRPGSVHLGHWLRVSADCS